MARILIVDDSSFQRRLIRGLLTHMGHEVIETDCGASGLETLRSEQPDLLILDLLMPEMTGYEVLETLQSEQASVPRLVLTADVQDSARRRCLNLGAVRVLNKPPKEPELRDAIDAALAATEAAR